MPFTEKFIFRASFTNVFLLQTDFRLSSPAEDRSRSHQVSNVVKIFVYHLATLSMAQILNLPGKVSTPVVFFSYEPQKTEIRMSFILVNHDLNGRSSFAQLYHHIGFITKGTRTAKT